MKNLAAKFILARVVVCLLLTLVLASGAAAQTDDTVTHEFGIWGGYSPDSSTVIKGTGRTPDARFGIAAVQYARRFNNSDAVNLKYTADFVPLAAMSFPDFRVVQTAPNAFRLERFRKTAYAWGVAPFGLQANFRPRKKAQPFINASGGLLYFDKQVPNDFGTRFSFTADVGGGVEFNLRNKRAVTVGYKYYHVSNGGRGAINPGFDHNLFYVGYRFFAK